jgi:sugar lactone lactonase YvrE
MTRISVAAIATLLFYLVSGASASDAATLWIADDTANLIYEVTLEGDLITSFRQVRGADSCIDVDFATDTLWGTAESKDRAVNFSKTGERPPACADCEREIRLAGFGADGPEGVGVDLDNDALWVVDDPADGQGTAQVFHVGLDRTLLSSFPVSSFDPAAVSPQGIAVDPADGTLWLTDNRTDLIYHVTQTGALIGSFSVLTYTGVTDPEVYNPNPQGITVDRSNGTLWVTDRKTRKIYNVTSGRYGEPAGDLLFYFDSTTYDVSSLNPTGVAYDGPCGESMAGDGSGSACGLPARILLIDEDSIDKGNPPNFFSDVDVNADVAELGLRTQLPFFAANIGETIVLHTGEVGDEGWFALKTIPDDWTDAGPTGDGLRNFVGLPVGPGLGAGEDPEAFLDKIPGVTPLRATGLAQLVGETVCAVVFDSDISINYDPLDGSLKGDNLGTVAFDVLEVRKLKGFSSSSLPKVNIEILDAEEVCEGALELFTDAPEPISSSEPFDVDPGSGSATVHSSPSSSASASRASR